MWIGVAKPEFCAFLDFYNFQHYSNKYFFLVNWAPTSNVGRENPYHSLESQFSIVLYRESNS